MKKIRITSDGTPQGTHVTLGGVEIGGIKYLSVEANAGESISTVLEVIPEFVDVKVLEENTKIILIITKIYLF